MQHRWTCLSTMSLYKHVWIYLWMLENLNVWFTTEVLFWTTSAFKTELLKHLEKGQSEIIRATTLQHTDCSHYLLWIAVALCLAKIELIFFWAAGVMLCFGFVAKQSWSHTNVVAEMCLHSTKSLPFLTPHLQWIHLGVHERLGGDAARKMTGNNWRDKTWSVTGGENKGI